MRRLPAHREQRRTRAPVGALLLLDDRRVLLRRRNRA